MSSKKKKASNQRRNTAPRSNVPILKPNRIHAIILAVLAFLLYVNTLNHEFAFDDVIVITENSMTPKGFAGIGELFTSDMFKSAGKETGELSGGRYRPLSLVMFAAEAQLFGKPKIDPSGRPATAPDGSPLYEYNAKAGHWINVIFYVLSALLIYRLLVYWFEKKPELSVVPFIATLLFLVHPVHTEVIANIKSRDEIMALALLAGALICWHLSLTRPKSEKMAVLGAILYFLSLLAKETTFTYMALFPVILWVIYKKQFADIWKPSVMLWVASIIYLFVRTSVIGLPKSAVATTGIMDNPFAMSDTAEKLGTVALICWRYLLLLFAPITLRCDYAFEHVPLVGLGHPESIAGILSYTGLLVFAYLGWKKRSMYTLSIGMFFFPLIITTNLLFNIGAPMGERFLYLPSFGFALAIAYGLVQIFSIDKLVVLAKKWPVAAGLGLYLCFFAFQTFARNPDWKNNETLFAKDVGTTPKSAKLQNYQGRILLSQWQKLPANERTNDLLLEARKHYEESVRIYPQFVLSLYDLGIVNLYLQDGPAAEKALQDCLNLNNTHGMTRELMAQVQYRLMGNYQKAADHLRYAIEKSDRRSANTLKDLGIYYARAAKPDSAAIYMEQAVQAAPNDIQVLKNAGVIFMQAGKSAKAQEYFQRAAALENK
ncbi:MAG: DUF1736 domain-containing protein [Flavobacteriales bacterium]|nr:DUF1736 domain-containing protein [Flavobacteriales bacterium]